MHRQVYYWVLLHNCIANDRVQTTNHRSRYLCT